MRARRLCCLLAVLVLIAPCALASDLQTALSRLSDEDIMRLYSMVVLEMYMRGLSPESIVEHVDTAHMAGLSSPPPRTTSPEEYLPAVELTATPEPTPTPAPTPLPTPRPTYMPELMLDNDDAVWITDSSKRFHTTPDCCGMKEPYAVTYYSAITSGRTACHDCAWWMIQDGE